mmetsp:Transcript_238/g.390  ORF Transcript_238/g.390 Transcript_238/m.390 type:complete len:537 (-) Transcript_238:144-1754(-)
MMKTLADDMSSPDSGPSGTADASSHESSQTAAEAAPEAPTLMRQGSSSSDISNISLESASSRRSSSLGLRTYVVDPRRAVHKYITFLLLCGFIPGPYFMDSLFVAYKRPICKDLGIHSTAFGILLALPSATGILCGVIGAMIVRHGEAKCAFSMGTTLFCTALCMTIGVGNHNYMFVLVARLLFWASLYVLCTVQTAAMLKLFSGQALSVAAGVIILSCRSGGMLGSFWSGFILAWAQGDPSGAMYCGVVFVAGCLVATGLFAYLRAGTATARAVLPLLEPAPRQSTQWQDVSYQEQIRSFTPMTWLLIANITFVYAVVFPFENIAFDYFEADWALPAPQAGMAMSLGPGIGMFAWAFGTVIKTEKSFIHWGIVAWTSFLIAFLVLGFQIVWNPVPAMLTFGTAYAYLSTSVWTLIPGSLRGRSHCTSAAVSVAYAGMAMSQSISNLVVGALHDLSGYFAVCIWFALLSSGGLVSAIMILRQYNQLTVESAVEAPCVEGVEDVNPDADESVVQHIEIARVQSEECYFEAPPVQSEK